MIMLFDIFQSVSYIMGSVCAVANSDGNMEDDDDEKEGDEKKRTKRRRRRRSRPG